MKNWPLMDWHQLVIEADTGQRGQGALVEAMRRLNASGTRLATTGNWLSVAMIVLAIVQVGLASVQLWMR